MRERRNTENSNSIANQAIQKKSVGAALAPPSTSNAIISKQADSPVQMEESERSDEYKRIDAVQIERDFVIPDVSETNRMDTLPTAKEFAEQTNAGLFARRDDLLKQIDKLLVIANNKKSIHEQINFSNHTDVDFTKLEEGTEKAYMDSLRQLEGPVMIWLAKFKEDTSSNAQLRRPAIEALLSSIEVQLEMEAENQEQSAFPEVENENSFFDVGNDVEQSTLPKSENGVASFGRQKDNILLDSSNIEKNKGLFDMVRNSKAILNDGALWEGQKSHKLALGNTLGGLAGAATGGAGAIAQQLDGTSKLNAALIPKSGMQTDFVQDVSGNVITAVGAGISTVISAVKSGASLYKAAKNKDLLAGGEGGRDFLAALQSGFTSAQEVLKYISGNVPPEIAATIPGLGIAVSACNIIIQAYKGAMAKQAENEMSEVSESYRKNLQAILGAEPESNKKLFHIEKRGKMGNRIEYMRLNSEVRDDIDEVNYAFDQDAAFTNLLSKLGLPINGGVTFEEFKNAIQLYELGSKLEEINQKRKVFAAREIAADLVSIAGDIAAFFPADAGITAATLKGASAAAKGGQAAAKFFNTKARNLGILGGNEERSDSKKHVEYVGHTKSIYNMMANINLDATDNTISEGQFSQAKSAENMIKAAGAAPDVIYKTDYNDQQSKTQQVQNIVESMKKGR